MTKQRVLIIILVVLGIVVWRLLASHPNQAQPLSATQERVSSDILHDDIIEEQKPPTVLTPEDPAKYGMVVISPEEYPKNPQEWEKILRAGFEKNKVFDSPEAKKTMEEVKQTREEFDQNVAKLNASIAKVEEELKNHPFDEESQNRLDTLYQLKAVSKILEEHAVRP